MADMIKVKNDAKYCIRVGGVDVRGGQEAEVDAAELASMSDKDAGPAANAMAKMLKKAAGRKAKVDDKTDDDPAITAVHMGGGKWNVLGLDGEVVEDGEGLNKADAADLRDKLIAESEDGE